jgi:hypothetical protein
MCERDVTFSRLLRPNITVVQEGGKGLARNLRECQENREFAMRAAQRELLAYTRTIRRVAAAASGHARRVAA